MSQHSQILAELSYEKRTNQEAGFRSDGQPYASRAKVSEEKRISRERARRIEDIAIAKDLGISLEELRGTL